jgi:hypothetical protein
LCASAGMRGASKLVVRVILTVAAVTIAAGDVWLGVISWRRRSVLAGLLGVVGIPVIALSVVGDPARTRQLGTLVVAAIMLTLGVALYGIGQLVQRLLDSEPEDHDRQT